ncbi:Aste57867_18358 [Aphanomyces stellatus]|uniref:Aste57867_18358 protein n=1 Tax=Aphanomyces stellatus TaxID=120398 RepID=A0A485L9W2_9STRA|nr:hypothetical protein As57867_018296 [Aphanomyces stellatus]VFT95094.1 Aste57867_18358 [Aphanomyces stellatus]
MERKGGSLLPNLTPRAPLHLPQPIHIKYQPSQSSKKLVDDDDDAISHKVATPDKTWTHAVALNASSRSSLWAPFAPATAICLFFVATMVCFPLLVVVSVVNDAQYRGQGVACGGTNATTPTGQACPCKGDIATSHCHVCLLSWNGYGCVAPTNAACVWLTGAWGCVFPNPAAKRELNNFLLRSYRICYIFRAPPRKSMLQCCIVGCYNVASSDATSYATSTKYVTSSSPVDLIG